MIDSAVTKPTLPLGATMRMNSWLAFGAVLQRVLRSERAQRLFNGVMGALLAASVLLIFW